MRTRDPPALRLSDWLQIVSRESRYRFPKSRARAVRECCTPLEFQLRASEAAGRKSASRGNSRLPQENSKAENLPSSRRRSSAPKEAHDGPTPEFRRREKCRTEKSRCRARRDRS